MSVRKPGSNVTTFAAIAAGAGLLLGGAGTASGAIIFDNEAADSFEGQVATNDLLQTALLSVDADGNFQQEGAGGEEKLRTGEWSSARGETAAITSTSSITYTFDGLQDITEIHVYGGWQDGGRARIDVAIDYREAEGEDWIELIPHTTFDPTDEGHTWGRMSILPENGGFLATDVGQMRFTFPSQKAGHAGYNEIDVIPEPASLALMGLGGLLLVRRRRASA